jgi:3-deoxy-D-manno-octulosonic-acid transferase
LGHGKVFAVRFNYPLQDAVETKERGLERVMMLMYSALLTVALVISAPWWLLRMATTQRYREGLRQRLGSVSKTLMHAAAGKRVVWVHAVSVGEVLAASRLVGELSERLGDAFCIVVSTTTRTGQALARTKFGSERVFYMPLDFAFSVRAYMRALKPEAVVLMESELWPRLLRECIRNRVPVAVVNARMSDRSFARAMRVRRVWGNVLRMPSLWLAQSEEDASRLVKAGARRENVHVTGNLKYDVRSTAESAMATRIREAVDDLRVVVAGSTLEGEEQILLNLWPGILGIRPNTVLVIAPRHPERFDAVAAKIRQSGYALLRCSEFAPDGASVNAGSVLLLDTIGDLASVYGIGAVAFVGGSLVPRGGHNPLEPAQFGVPVVMGPNFQNFRDIVATMLEMDGLRVVRDAQELQATLLALLTDPQLALAVGERGRRAFEEQQGATARTVEAILGLIAVRR